MELTVAVVGEKITKYFDIHVYIKYLTISVYIRFIIYVTINITICIKTYVVKPQLNNTSQYT